MPTQLGKHFWPEFSFIDGLRLDYLSPTLYLTDVFIFLIFLLNFKELIKYLKNVNRKHLLIYCLFLASLVLGTISSVNNLAGWYGLAKILELSFVVYYVKRNIKSLDKKIIFFCILIPVVFESVLAFWQYLNQGAIGGIFYYFGERAFTAQTPGIANASINGQLFLRPYATLPHPNVLAGFLIIYSLLMLLYIPKQKFLKTFMFLVLILASFIVTLTLGRTAILLWAAYVFVLFGLAILEKYKKTISKKQIASLLLLVLFFITFMYLTLQKTTLVQRFTSITMSDESVVQRETLTGQALIMFEKKPLLGVGLNNFYNNLNFSQADQNFLFIQPVHNIFLLTLSEAGIVGLLFFIYFLYYCFSALERKTAREKTYLSLMLFAVVFLGMFDHYFLTVQQGQLMVSIILGISLSPKNSRAF